MKDALLQKRADIISSHIDDEVVMMSIESGEYYGLNPVASRIWEILETPYSFQQLIDILLKEFDVDREKCEKDVQTFLNQMIKKKLIVYV